MNIDNISQYLLYLIFLFSSFYSFHVDALTLGWAFRTFLLISRGLKSAFTSSLPRKEQASIAEDVCMHSFAQVGVSLTHSKIARCTSPFLRERMDFSDMFHLRQAAWKKTHFFLACASQSQVELLLLMSLLLPSKSFPSPINIIFRLRCSSNVRRS